MEDKFSGYEVAVFTISIESLVNNSVILMLSKPLVCAAMHRAGIAHATSPFGKIYNQ